MLISSPTPQTKLNFFLFFFHSFQFNSSTTEIDLLSFVGVELSTTVPIEIS